MTENPEEILIMNKIEKTKEYINQYLLPIIRQSGEYLEGNLFMLNHTLEYTDFFIKKPKNICSLLLNKNSNIKNVMEIGFNSGFSTLLMLITNENINVTCYDLGEHRYTMPCFNKLKETFGDRIKIILGNSKDTLKNDTNQYDLIHIDGCHYTEIAESDIKESYRLSKKGTIIIMDDYDVDNLHNLWNKYIEYYNLQSLKLNTLFSETYIYDTPCHDIKCVI